MSFVSLAFSSSAVRALSGMREGDRGVVVEVRGKTAAQQARAERLLALGVSAGARITVLQTFPGIVFLCDQTELAVERSVAEFVLVRSEENPS
jgi:Fe2+ transport system protein FeoA